jgi:hypothetical protein
VVLDRQRADVLPPKKEEVFSGKLEVSFSAGADVERLGQDKLSLLVLGGLDRVRISSP